MRLKKHPEIRVNNSCHHVPRVIPDGIASINLAELAVGIVTPAPRGAHNDKPGFYLHRS